MTQPRTQMQHDSFIKTPKQLIVVVVLGFLVPVLLAIFVSQIVTTGLKVEPSALTNAAVVERIAPVARVEVSNEPPPPRTNVAAAPSAPVPAPIPIQRGALAAAPAAAGDVGLNIYNTACSVCHAAGIAGAPKAGDKAGWAPRLAQGMETLYANAIKGKGAMPPKGGRTDLPDADIKASVDYLIKLVK